MPTYDYRCEGCDHKWELFQSIKANPVRKCPSCGKPKAKRMIGPGAGIIFKGSGFYQTDYRSDSYKKAAEADTKSQSSGDGKADKGDKAASAKSDAKTGSSTEAKPSSEKKSKRKSSDE